MIQNVTCPLQFCVQMLPGDSTFVRTWHELAEFHQNLCTLISITALGCFLYYSSPSFLLIWTTLLVLLANRNIDLQNHVPAYFPERLPMVEMKRLVVLCIPEKGISQEKKAHGNKMVASHWGYAMGIFIYWFYISPKMNQYLLENHLAAFYSKSAWVKCWKH